MAMIKINGTDVASPSSFRASHRETGSMERAASGASVMDWTGRKWTLNLKWAYLSDTDRAALVSAMESGFFTATVPNPSGTGTVTKEFSCLTYSVGIAMVRDGQVWWTDAEAEWEER